MLHGVHKQPIASTMLVYIVTLVYIMFTLKLPANDTQPTDDTSVREKIIRSYSRVKLDALLYN